MAAEAHTSPWNAASLGQQLALVLASRDDESVLAWSPPAVGDVALKAIAGGTTDTAAMSQFDSEATAGDTTEAVAMEESDASKSRKRKSIPAQGGKAKKKMGPRRSSRD
jgi:hypothetical protein